MAAVFDVRAGRRIRLEHTGLVVCTEPDPWQARQVVSLASHLWQAPSSVLCLKWHASLVSRLLQSPIRDLPRKAQPRMQQQVTILLATSVARRAPSTATIAGCTTVPRTASASKVAVARQVKNSVGARPSCLTSSWHVGVFDVPGTPGFAALCTFLEMSWSQARFNLWSA